MLKTLNQELVLRLESSFLFFKYVLILENFVLVFLNKEILLPLEVRVPLLLFLLKLFVKNLELLVRLLLEEVKLLLCLLGLFFGFLTLLVVLNLKEKVHSSLFYF